MKAKARANQKHFSENVNGIMMTEIACKMWDANVAPLDALVLVEAASQIRAGGL